jgi:hypothetical protein
MRKYLPHAVIILALLILFNLPTIITVIFELILLGAVPGTTISIPFWVMLPLMVFLGFIVVHWLSHQPLYIGNLEYQEKLARQLARKKVAEKIATARAAEPQPTVKASARQFVRTIRTSR